MEGKFFKLRSALNGLVLDVEGSNESPGARVTMWPETGGANQLWYQEWITGTIRSKLNDFCLEITSSGAVMNPFHPDEYGQQWTIGDEHVHQNDNPGMVLDISASNPDQGSDLCAWELHGGPNQTFIPEYTECLLNCFFIKSQMNGKVMDVEEASTDAGTKVIMYDQNSDAPDNQLFYEDKYGMIHSKLNDFVLDFDDGKIRVNPYDPMKDSQQWVISGDTIRHKVNHNQVIDIIDEDSWNGAYLCGYDFHGKSNQLWNIEYI